MLNIIPDKPKFIVRRKTPLLCESLMAYGQSNPKYYQGIINKDFILLSRLYLDEKIYWFEKEMDDLSNKLVTRAKKNPRFLEDIVRICYKEGNELIQYSENIKRQGLLVAKFSNSTLIKLFSGFAERTMRIVKFLSIPLALENYLTQNLLDALSKRNLPPNLVDKYLKILIAPIKQNDVVLERKELLKMVSDIKKDKTVASHFQKDFISFKKYLKTQNKLKNRLESHLDKFAWLTCPCYIGKPINLRDLYNQIKLLLKTNIKNIKKELDTIEKEPEIIRKKTQSIINSCRFSSQERKHVWLVKEYVYLRTYRTDIIHKSGYNVRHLLREIGRRNGYLYNDILYLTFKEIKSIFKRKISKSIIRERKRGFAYYHKNRINLLYTGKQINKLRHLLRQSIPAAKITEGLIGQSAYSGRITGVARLVLSPRQIGKIKTGDVLVTSMTTPVLMPAIKKAAAIVTDEGGILCHAAIISRELKKPCIIGTKIATKVLKDGQLVEVDANKGIVRIY